MKLHAVFPTLLGLALASGVTLPASGATTDPLTDRSTQLTFQASLIATDAGGITTSYPIPNVSSLVLRRQAALADCDRDGGDDDGPAPNTLTLDTLDGELLADGSNLVDALRQLILNNGTVTAQLIFQFPAGESRGPSGSLVQLGGVTILGSRPLGPANQDWTSLKAFALTRIRLAFSTCQVTPQFLNPAQSTGGTDDGSSGTTVLPGTGSGGSSSVGPADPGTLPSTPDPGSGTTPSTNTGGSTGLNP